MSFTYHAYGLVLDSELPLPELSPANGPADVRLRIAPLEPLPSRPEEPWYSWKREGSTTWLWRDNVGTFRLRDGKEILLNPHPEVESGLLRDYLLNSVMGALLQQRGCLMLLHASSVLLDGEAVVFVGESGEGKSTMTAALHTRGCPVVSDELVPVDFSGGELRVWPAFARLKLTVASAEAVGCPPEALTKLYTAEEKRGWQAAPADPGAALPLSCIYLLRSGEQHSIRPGSSADAVGELVRQSFHKRLLPAEQLQQHFLACAELARSGRVRLLTRRRSLAELETVVRLVEADVRSLA